MKIFFGKVVFLFLLLSLIWICFGCAGSGRVTEGGDAPMTKKEQKVRLEETKKSAEEAVKQMRELEKEKEELEK